MTARPGPRGGAALAAPPPRPASLDGAYAACTAITSAQARNFAWGIRLLPPPRREALSAVYALARRIDDIGDGALPLPDKRAALAAVRAQLGTTTTARPASALADPVMAAVTDTASRFPVPLGAFEELLDGVERDVEMDAGLRTVTDVDDLLDYCRCVAGSVGRLCLGVFAARPHPAAPVWADSLGLALQITNVLRDVREDLAGGRVYLPASELAAHGVDLRLGPDGALVPQAGLPPLVRSLAQRARVLYAEGWQLLSVLDARSAACTATMAGIYRQLLERIAARPELVYDRRLSLSAPAKAAVAVRALVGGGR